MKKNLHQQLHLIIYILIKSLLKSMERLKRCDCHQPQRIYIQSSQKETTTLITSHS